MATLRVIKKTNEKKKKYRQDALEMKLENIHGCLLHTRTSGEEMKGEEREMRVATRCGEGREEANRWFGTERKCSSRAVLEKHLSACRCGRISGEFSLQGLELKKDEEELTILFSKIRQ